MANTEIKSGSIPKKLKFFIRREETVHFRWDDIEDEVGDGIKVSPTYVVDANNKKTHESAERWAKQEYYEQGKSKKHPHTEEERDNKPTSNVRLVNLEFRGNGGRAYKVVVDGRFYFDLREDVLLDCILNAGIDKGGLIKAEFLFMVVNAEMKLVRVGSLLHEKMIAADAFKDTKAITSFEIGGQYKSKKTEAVYLGVWETASVETAGNRHSGWQTTADYHITGLKDAGSYHVFFEVTDWRKWGDKDASSYSLSFVKKPSAYKEKTGQHVVDPVKFLTKLKEKSEKDVEARLKDGIKHNRKDRVADYVSDLEYYARTLNLSKESGYIHPFIVAAIKP